MPTYDYACDACGHQFELFQGINDPVETKCPQCKKKKLRRLLGTGAAIMFKGSGFYQTDYRSDSYRKAAAADKGSGGGESKSEGSKSDSAGSAKSESSSKSESKPSKSSSPAKKSDKK